MRVKIHIKWHLNKINEKINKNEKVRGGEESIQNLLWNCRNVTEKKWTNTYSTCSTYPSILTDLSWYFLTSCIEERWFCLSLSSSCCSEDTSSSAATAVLRWLNILNTDIKSSFICTVSIICASFIVCSSPISCHNYFLDFKSSQDSSSGRRRSVLTTTGTT